MDVVELCEVGPRDGFQFESVRIPTDFKRSTIERLARAGLQRIQAVSFVHPGRVPQMADAEALLAAVDVAADTTLTGLVLNMRGLERAIDVGMRAVDLSIALNETHARDNANSTVEEGIVAAEAMLERAAAADLSVQLGFQTVWGYSEPGDTPLDLIADVARRFAGRGLESVSLADSTGMAAPPAIRTVVDRVRAIVPDTPLVLHLHDTRGLGLANIAAALDLGVRRFDTSLGGLGGCPFIPGATGNVATEDVAYLAARMGFETGVDTAAVAAVSRDVSDLVGRALSGRMYRLI